jgi:hypothetical protein
MATYIQGVTDYLPVIQPFQPDYNFLSNVLQTKQSRYDAAHKQLSSVYGTLLNSPMLRDQNIKRREEFFKAIDQDIQRMSGMDLSLQQNQDAALNVFKGFYEDKDMVKDMLWTKNYMSEHSRAESFKDCVDPEKCGGSWWEGGVKALDYRAQEFKMASDKEALSFANASFVPAQDLMGKAMKAAKESGFSIKYDEVKGDWIVTTKNGSKMVQPLAEYFVSKFGSDPKMMDYYKTSAYVQRKDWVNQNLANYGDENEANLAYVAQMYSSTRPVVERGKEEADQVADAARNESEKIDRYIKQNGYIPTMNFANQWKDVKDEHAVAVQTKQVYDDAYNKLEALGYNRDNIRFVVDQIDGLVGLNMLKGASLNAASAYASLTSEMEIKANPYALQAKDQAFQRSMKQMDQAFQLQMKQMEWEREDRVREEAMKKLVGAGGNLIPSVDKSGWSATDVQEKLRSHNVNVEQKNKLAAEIDGAKKEKVITILTAAQEAYANGSASYGDLSYMLLKAFRGSKSGIDPAKFIKNDPAEMAKFNKALEDGSIMVNMYEALNPYADPNSALGAINKDWTSGIQPKINQIDQKLNETRQFYGTFDKWHKKEVGDVVTNATVAELRNKGNALEADAFQFMFDGLSKDGFYPKTSSITDNSLRERASQWAQQNQDKFESEISMTGPTGTVSYKVPRLNVKGQPMSNDQYEKSSYDFFNAQTKGLQDVGVIQKTAYQKAYEFALTSITNNEDSWRTNYNIHGKAWDNPKSREGGNAKATMAGRGIVDAAAQSTITGNVMIEMLGNYENLKDDAIVVYGSNLGASKALGTDKSAQAIFEQWAADFRKGSPLDKNGLPTEDNRAIANFEIARIAGQDPNLMGFRIKPAYSWGKQYRSSEGKSDKLIDNDKYTEEGIVVYLPKNKVQGSFMRGSEYNMYDFMMETDGQLKVDRPGGGNATLTMINGQYHLTTVVDVVNPDGTKSKMSNTTVHGMDFDLPTFVQTYQQGLDYQAIVNQQSLFNIAAQTGTKDPNQVFNR